MLNCNIMKTDKLTNSYTYNYKDMERFDIEHHAINRHDRRAIKSKYRKLNKRKK